MAENLNEVEEMEDDGIIVLVDDNGVEREFTHLATVDYKDNWYIVLEPNELFDDLEDGDVLIYRIGINDDGEDSFENIEDQEELDGAFNAFMELVESEEDEDCECCGHHHCDCGCEDCDDCE